MRKTILALAVALLCSVASANEYGIALAPGETLVAVNGVPVGQQRCTIDAKGNRVCNMKPIQQIKSTVVAPLKATSKAVRYTFDLLNWRRR